MTDLGSLLQQTLLAPRFGPAWFAVILAVLLLLFIGDMPDSIRTGFLPFLMVYALVAYVIATFHRLLGSVYNNKGRKEFIINLKNEYPHLNAFEKGKIIEGLHNESFIPWYFRLIIWLFHGVLLFAFLYFNYTNGNLPIIWFLVTSDTSVFNPST